MRTSKIIALVLGSILALGSLGLIGGGAVLVWAHNTQRDVDGYYTTETHRYETDTYAIATRQIDLGADPGGPSWNPISSIGTARIVVDPADGGEVFVGIGRSRDVRAYLDGVEHVTFESTRRDPFVPRYRLAEGGPPATPPGEEGFWVASEEGAGTQTLTWDVEGGSYTVVVMRADGSAGVAVDASAGLATGWLGVIGAGSIGLGLVLAAVSLALLLIGTSDDETTATQAAAGVRAPVGPPPFGRAHPVWLEGRRDPQLSRWLWLVKWFLAIPHLIVLAFLGAAAFGLTIVAGVVILFTGRYPTSIFRIVVGILRWGWRVVFYAFVLGTDRYPPFTLDDVPDYPARFDVAEPQRMSQPLVLVKWWLLALPHLLIVAVFVGGWTFGFPGGADDGRIVFSGGLVGLLALIAGVGLLFNGRYPPGLFDLIMGMERWTARVLGYVLLMTDDYPPFRLDPGGEEPPAGGRRASDPPARDPEPDPLADSATE
ncbi:DUF4389 domain-containing protein [Actinomarinicola tropica]|uniref:DUF4389 domain-containing protein n=1 Tax=Actinomarinicola tropica TaxID=2789776 RepID=A0A5Q2RSL6_9ACTN|nr:DUF4389 domain-containing protein [Actinomarinicola tropica]QGG96195.1 DUF4389 domain-containing protein [Actinomarinicola tropica]